MASQLSVAQKKQLVEYKIDFQKDGGKLPYKDQLAYCQQNFKQSPSESAIGRIWQDRENGCVTRVMPTQEGSGSEVRSGFLNPYSSLSCQQSPQFPCSKPAKRQ